MGAVNRPLRDRVILVTGAASGLGRCTAIRLAGGGARVIAADLDVAAAEQTARRCVEAGGEGRPLQLDVADPAAGRDAIGQLFEEYGPSFDCLVNNAGTDRGADVLSLDDEQWRQVMGVNVDGPLFLTREFLRCVVAGGPRQFPADIVNVISISAITVGTAAAAYNASKAALAKLTEVVQREAHEYEWPARIHGLMPSAMNTPMMDQWHLADEVMMDPDTVASAIEFMVTLPPDTFVQNLVINSRREPGWPR
jgi:NAD(P)-dependent dehydrogenase (short-subunit alcohol dehydrogenase family)